MLLGLACAHMLTLVCLCNTNLGLNYKRAFQEELIQGIRLGAMLTGCF